jgi:hypothetical protein
MNACRKGIHPVPSESAVHRCLVRPGGDRILDPWHAIGADPRLTPGIERDLVLGQADTLVGNVNRVGLGGGECVIGL